MKKIILISSILFCLCGCSRIDFDTWAAGHLLRVSDKSSKMAIGLYLDALKSAPDAAIADKISFQLGKIYFNSGEYEKAAEQFYSSESLAAKEFLARALFKNRDYTGALEVFNKLGEKGSDEYLYDYALAAEKSNLYDQALRIYKLIVASGYFKDMAQERIRAINLASGRELFAGVDDDVKSRVELSPSQEDYPDASGIYLLLEDSIELTSDNREISDLHYVVKVLNDRGKEKFAEVSLEYDSTYEKLELIYARTIKPDGTVITVGDKNIRDVSLYLNFPLYSNARVRIISMPEVVPGSVIEYKARITRVKLPNKKDFNSTYWLQADEPILLQRCSIVVPKDRVLKYKIVNPGFDKLGFDMIPKKSDEGGKWVYSLEFSNVPQIVPEPGMPPMTRIDPYVLFSTFDSWQDIYVWWRGLYKDKVVPDDDIRAKAGELVLDKKTRKDKIRAIYNYCVQDIRYVAVEYGDAGYEPHHASEIFKNKYGDCKDKAILLISMLNSVGIEAHPVLISTFDSFDLQEDVPSLLFNHAIAAVEIDKQMIFMDATANTVSFGDIPAGDQGRTALVFLGDEYRFVNTPVSGPDYNKIFTKMSIKIGKDEGMEAKREVVARGFYQEAQRFWLKFTMPSLIEEQLKQKARAIASSALLGGYKIENVDDLDLPVFLSYTFAAEQYLKKAGNSRILGQLGGVDVSLVVKETRTYPIEFSVLTAQEEDIQVELPAHLEVKYLPSPVRIETKWFDFINSYEIVSKNKLRFYALSRSKVRQVSLADYPEYKKALEEAAALSDQQLVIEEKR